MEFSNVIYLNRALKNNLPKSINAYIFMISLKFKEMFYVDYSLAYTIIKQHGLTDKDKEKIEKMKMDPGVKKAIYEILKIQ